VPTRETSRNHWVPAGLLGAASSGPAPLAATPDPGAGRARGLPPV